MPRVRYKRVALFLFITFSLSWGFEPLVALTIQQPTYLATNLNPLGMFFPAFSALFLQIYVFKDSPLYFRTYKEKTRWVYDSYLLLTIINGVITMLALTTKVNPAILQAIGGITVVLWTLGVFYFYGKSGPESFQRAGLQLGDTDLGLRFIAGVVLFLLSQAALNWLFGLGKFPGIQETVAGVSISPRLYPFALIVIFLISVTGVPLSGLAVVFGEEYGWRGFLHNELVKLGSRRGVFLVGLIWGIWHIPIILSGIHTYPATIIGLRLSLVFFLLVGFIFGYAVIITRSIWVVAFMQGVLNSIYPFVLTYLIVPYNSLNSFGLGIYGLICLAIIVLILLRDPIWARQQIALWVDGNEFSK